MANSYNLNGLRKCDKYIQEMFEIFEGVTFFS